MLVDQFPGAKETIRAQLTKAIMAMQKYAEKKHSQTSQETGVMDLLPEPESVTLSMSLNRIPVKKDYRFNVIFCPHQVFDITNKSLCLLASDPKEKAVTAVAKEELPFEKIVALKSLKKKYSTIEGRQELASRYEMFFCEEKIFEIMGKLLGKQFFQDRKSKIPICLRKLNKANFERALRTARFRVRGGSVAGIRIGNRGMEVEHLVDNAMAVVQFMATDYLVRNKNNVFNISIGATNLIDLPVWSVPVRKIVKVETEEPAVVAPETPVKEVEEAEPAVEVADIATVPIKKLKQVQKQRVEVVKAQLETATEKPKKKQRRA
jgi:ribosomal protein L1